MIECDFRIDGPKAGLGLSDVYALDNFLPIKGKLGIWNYEF
jgi:hypothetical protein